MVKSIKISGPKLAALRARLFFSQDELGARLEMAGGSVGRLEQQREGGMLPKNFRKLEGVAKTTPEKLLAEIGAGDPKNGAATIGLSRVGEIEMKTVPLYRHLFATGFREAAQDSSAERTPIPGEVSADFAAEIVGECMSPKYLP